MEVSNLNRRIRNMEDEMEQLTTKLRTTNDKLEDIAKAADECERLIKISVVDCSGLHLVVTCFTAEIEIRGLCPIVGILCVCRVCTDSGKVWKVLEFNVDIFKALKTLENDHRYGKVWKNP